ncbi:hypothetical protein BDW42DRAFT_193067 [Aspergillus taichungensis]|uniref:Uncharacterized protein n=1 Tax=Aspergillus taichungensis TaxID=482145 RepID=A0A2J5HYC4_9EURO|nr:hypothetical protein BDW42DRAFT_193067 [Aspergillus taichungensis]
MRFISIATTLFLATTALAGGVGCEKKCYFSSAEAGKVCKAPTPAVVPNGPGCFKCCKSA